MGDVTLAERDGAAAVDLDAAFDALYREHRASVVAAVARRGVRAPDVEDIVQTSFTDLYAVRHKTEPGAWRFLLFSIAKNKAIDDLRRRRRWAERNMPLSDADQPAHASEDPLDIAVAVETARLVQVAVSQATPVHQQLLHAVFVEGRRHYGELVPRFGANVEAVRSTARRAQTSVRRHLTTLGVRVVALLAAVRTAPRAAARRLSRPRPWTVAGGQGVAVTLLATSLVMAPPVGVPAQADAGPVWSPKATASMPAMNSQAGRDAAAAANRRDDRSRPPAGTPVATGGESAHDVSVAFTGPVVPEKPCVRIPPYETCEEHPIQGTRVTVRVPVLGVEVYQDENYVRLCPYVPDAEPIVTCDEEEGAKYALDPPRRPAGV